MTVTAPAGFDAAGVACGLKSSGSADLALVVNRGPRRAAAAVFTSNRAKANPILWSQQVIADGEVSAIVLNSGGANCFTGAQGFQTTERFNNAVGRDYAAPGVTTVSGGATRGGSEEYQEVVQVGIFGDPFEFRDAADIARVGADHIDRVAFDQRLEILAEIDLLTGVDRRRRRLPELAVDIGIDEGRVVAGEPPRR